MKTLASEVHTVESAEAAATCGVLVTRLGGSYSRLLGIGLASKDSDEVFKWLMAAVLLGAPIRAGRAIDAYAAFESRSLLRPGRLANASEATVVQLLNCVSVQAYSSRIAATLRSVAGSVEKDYDYDINRLHFFAEDAAGLEQRVRSLGTGLSRRVVAVFLREMRGVWEKVPQEFPPMAVEAARHLGLTEARRLYEATDELRDVWESAAHGERTFSDFQAALVRLGENYCSMRRCASCPMAKLCVSRLVAKRSADCAASSGREVVD